MQLIRQILKPAGWVLALFTLMISGPIQSASAALIETLLIIAFLVFLILLITDIAGYTDVFPFVK
jgi:hypothetical protein